MPLRPKLPWDRATTSAGTRNVWKLSVYVGAGLLAMGVAGAALGLLLAAELPRYSVEERRSGYTYLSEENQRLQDDDFANPIEPSIKGGSRIAQAITRFLTDDPPGAHVFGKR